MQAVGHPPYSARAKGVGVGWCGGGAAFNMLNAQLQGMPKIELKDIDFPALILVRVPGAPAGSDEGMAPPIMTTAATVVRPAGKKFKKAELKAAIAGWGEQSREMTCCLRCFSDRLPCAASSPGFKHEGVHEEWDVAHVLHATRCGAGTAILAAIADGDGESADADGPNRLALEALRAFNADNASAPVQALLHNVSSAKEWQADRLSRLSRHYGWTPARLPGATDHSHRSMSAGA